MLFTQIASPHYKSAHLLVKFDVIVDIIIISGGTAFSTSAGTGHHSFGGHLDNLSFEPCPHAEVLGIHLVINLRERKCTLANHTVSECLYGHA